MGYPPGAQWDKRAPYNQTSQRSQSNKVVDVVTDEDCNEIECTVNYRYEEDEDYGSVNVTYYEHHIKQQHSIPEDILDEQIRDIIKEQFSNKYEFYWS